MDKSEKLGQLKECICKIEEDITMSCKNGCPDKETLMNRNILECLKYISELLDDTIYESSSNTPQTRKRFFITDEQREQLQITPNAKVTDIANELNRVTQNNNTSKITTTWITEWLISVGILEINELSQRVPTQTGREIGITSQLMQISYSKVQLVNYYPKNVQEFIYNNIKSIIDFHYSNPTKSSHVKNDKNRFFITNEQREQLQIVKSTKISDIVNELNRFMQENNTQQIQTAWITNWLVSTGIFERNDMNRGIPTKIGNEIGITRELIKKDDGSAYFQIWYSEKAQMFIYDNIEAIIAFHYGEN